MKLEIFVLLQLFFGLKKYFQRIKNTKQYSENSFKYIFSKTI